MAKQAGDGVGVKQLGVILHYSLEAFCYLAEGEGQIKFCQPAVSCKTGDGHAWQVQELPWSILQDKHHLKQRRAAHIPFRPQLFDQLLKGQILVRIGPQSHFTHPLQHFEKRRIARQISAQD